MGKFSLNVFNQPRFNEVKYWCSLISKTRKYFLGNFSISGASVSTKKACDRACDQKNHVI